VTESVFARDPRQEWGTLDALFNPLNDEFRFTLDVAATMSNCKVITIYGEEGEERYAQYCGPDHVIVGRKDGLKYDWTDEKAFCNPGFGKAGLWAEKCVREVVYGDCPVAVMISHISHGSEWWIKWARYAAELRLLFPRPNFVPADSIIESKNDRDIVALVFKKSDKRIYEVPWQQKLVYYDWSGKGVKERIWKDGKWINGIWVPDWSRDVN